MIDLFDELEALRKTRLGPDNSGPIDWHGMRHGLVFFVLCCVTILTYGWQKYNNPPPAKLLFVLSAAFGFAAMTLVLRASGAFKRRAPQPERESMQSRPRGSGMFPFYTLRYKIEDDCDSVARLARFSDDLLSLACERIRHEESHLRDVATVVFGSVPAVFVLGIPAAIWSAWESTHGKFTILTLMILVAAIVGVFLSAYGIYQRLSVFDLSRSRELVELEIARRRMTNPQ